MSGAGNASGTWLPTAGQIRAIEAEAQRAFGVSTLQLMESAGIALARAAQRERGGDLRPVVVVAGKGQNGGDGLCAARHLHAQGIPVRVFLAAPAQAVSGDAARQLQAAQAGLSLTVLDGDQALQPWLSTLRSALQGCSVAIDALLGTGLRGAPVSPYDAAIAALNESGRPVIAADVPSGLDADTGKAPGFCVRAMRTVTFGLPKRGLLVHPGAELAGRLQLARIGLPPKAAEGQVDLIACSPDAARRLLPARAADVHKHSAGRVVVWAGAPGMAGAAALSARAALRAGAGLVTLVGDEEVITAAARTTPEVIGARGAQPSPELLQRADAIAIGPGLAGGSSQAAAALRDRLESFLAACPLPVVLDADALRAFEGDLAGLGRALAAMPGAVLTPHPGELAALLGSTSAQVQAGRLAAARAAAQQCGAVVLLKGAGTVVSPPEGPAWLNTSGHPVLATAGSGDVLTGTIATLLAQGLTPLHAAVLGAYWHGLAGEMTARTTPRGALAGEFADALPAALQALTAGEIESPWDEED